MKVICKQTTSNGFDLKYVSTILSNDFDYGYGGYGLELGKEYIVMGIVLYRDSNCLYYLIDVNSRPDWFPYLLFDISSDSLVDSWHIKINMENQNTDVYCLLGFYELCKIDDFYHRLIERDEEAMRIYFRRKIEREKLDEAL